MLYTITTNHDGRVSAKTYDCINDYVVAAMDDTDCTDHVLWLELAIDEAKEYVAEDTAAHFDFDDDKDYYSAEWLAQLARLRAQKDHLDHFAARGAEWVWRLPLNMTNADDGWHVWHAGRLPVDVAFEQAKEWFAHDAQSHYVFETFEEAVDDLDALDFRQAAALRKELLRWANFENATDDQLAEIAAEAEE